ncbi:Txe/YoeB family addiction module toxin [Algibacter pectinivorans]|uniref:Putative mRNA interferase YoeB n=1 Tax=Algibacter pectinivorans TaxID=870482 RepID=A0A1I1NNL9_9FLAO|nr:Txe/YoeB family addiction module toxin [Algibacter pectinivorans]SFC95340.1 toxin YoeB [Algibacter pectinivorans]
MNVFFSSNAFEDFCYWQSTDRKIFNKLTRLIKNTQRTPFDGIGTPEPLKENLSGYWSRRITHEHRLVYKVSGNKGEQVLTIIQCRYHY